MLHHDYAVFTLNGSPLTKFVAGVFFTNSDGDLKCAGFAEFDEATTAGVVGVWGDDFLTDEKDGLSVGDPLVWRIFDCSSGVEVPATVEYAEYPGATETFEVNGMAVVSSLSGETDECVAPDSWVTKNTGNNMV